MTANNTPGSDIFERRAEEQKRKPKRRKHRKTDAEIIREAREWDRSWAKFRKAKP